MKITREFKVESVTSRLGKDCKVIFIDSRGFAGKFTKPVLGADVAESESFTINATDEFPGNQGLPAHDELPGKILRCTLTSGPIRKGFINDELALVAASCEKSIAVVMRKTRMHKEERRYGTFITPNYFYKETYLTFRVTLSPKEYAELARIAPVKIFTLQIGLRS